MYKYYEDNFETFTSPLFDKSTFGRKYIVQHMYDADDTDNENNYIKVI